MDKLRIQGGNRLQGKVIASGSKNAALPILFSSLLTEEKCRFRRIPKLQDIHFTLRILERLGVRIQDFDGDGAGGGLELQVSAHVDPVADYDWVRKMRASILLLGPFLARFGTAHVSLPGGCAIGARPVNYHLDGFKKLGATINIESGYIHATAKRLQGARIVLEYPSVGATENLLMAASLARGQTVIQNAAREPEIVDLARMLRKMGVILEGEGTEEIHIQGRDSLSGVDHAVIGDRIEAGTFLVAGFITQGDVEVCGVDPVFLDVVLDKLEAAGAGIERTDSSVRLRANGRAKATNVVTQPYPGFPTDMQAQFLALMTLADGVSVVDETVFENRFMHVPELSRLGADIQIKGHSAVIRGCTSLRGAPLMATDLRASASLILAGLAAEGETIVNRIYHLDRGYESMEKKLQGLGAQIERIS